MIVAFLGKAGSGKSTAATLLLQLVKCDGEAIAFADPLKRFCKEIFAWSDVHVHGSLKEVPDPDWARAPRPPLTPREAMQTLGTEWGRACHPDVWVRYALRRAKQLEADGGRLIILHDARFLNEARAVSEAGGRVIRLLRQSALAGAAATHPSETELDRPEVQQYVSCVIDNSGPIEVLQRALTEFAIGEGLLEAL